MSSGLIAQLIDLANTSDMNNKHAAAITYGKRILSFATNCSLWGSSDRTTVTDKKSWQKLQDYVRCDTKGGTNQYHQECQY